MRHLIAIAAAALVLGFASQASAISYTLNDSFGSDPVSGDIIVDITDFAANTVQVDIDLTALNTTEFIKEIYLNTNTAVTSASWSSPTSIDGLNYSLGGFKADGDGFHDVLVQFSESAGSRMNGGSTYSFFLAGTNLDETDFDDLGTSSSKGQFHAVAKINGTGSNGDGSDWVGDGPGAPVPEPGAALLFGVGAVVVGARVRRR